MHIARYTIAAAALFAACSTDATGDGAGGSGGDAAGPGAATSSAISTGTSVSGPGSTTTTAAGSGGGDGACVSTQPHVPPEAGLWACADPTCLTVTLHSEIQWGHPATDALLQCAARTVDAEGAGVVRWREDLGAHVVVLLGDGTAWRQALREEFTGGVDEVCWTLDAAELCDVAPPECEGEVCEWNPERDLDDCVAADPQPTCDDVAALGTSGGDCNQWGSGTEADFCVQVACCSEAAACLEDSAACFGDDGLLDTSLPAGAALDACMEEAGCVEQ